jgi:hypothetical protein
MGQSNISRAPEGMARPSLLNATSAAPTPSILDAMGRGPSTTPSSSRRSPIGGMLLVLGAAMVWGLWQLSIGETEPARSNPATGQLAQTAPAAHRELPRRSEAPAEAPSVQVASLEPAPQAAPDTSPLHATTPLASTNPFNGLKTGDDGYSTGIPASPPPRPTAPATQRAEPKPVAAPQPPPRTKAEKTEKTAKPASKTKPAVTAVAAARTPSKSRPSTSPPSANGATSDPDVALIDAIMKHMGDRQTPIDAGKHSPQTIAELVKTCQSKDSIEGLLCRRRICEGSWGKAQACPMELAPKKSSALSAPTKVPLGYSAPAFAPA